MRDKKKRVKKQIERVKKAKREGIRNLVREK